MIMVKKVVTVSGNTVDRQKCCKIKHLYYEKNVDCFFINKSWYRKNSGLILYDYEKCKWLLKKESYNINFVYGICYFENDTPVLGHYTSVPQKNVSVYYKGNQHMCIGLNVIPENMKVVEHISTGIFFINPDKLQFSECSVIRNRVNMENNPYNIEDDLNKFNILCDIYKESKYKIPIELIRYSHLLGDISFGIEIETIRGYMPVHLQYQNSVVICRDGSLKDPNDGTQGAEFTTIPLSGAKGLYVLKNLCNDLKDRTEIDLQCALHLHIGNIKTDKLSLLNLYKLCYMIQDDMFKMFPYYKLNEVEYAQKNKNYCKKLSDLRFNKISSKISKDVYKEFLNLDYQLLFSFLSEGQYSCNKFNRKNKRHPRLHKWERHSRYYWVNFMNTIFSSRNTVEFRIHQGTTNFTKISSWLFICNAIVKFAEKNSKELSNNKLFKLSDVLNYYRSINKDGVILSDYLLNYYNERSKHFLDEAAISNYLGKTDLKLDRVYSTDNTILNKFFSYDKRIH